MKKKSLIFIPCCSSVSSHFLRHFATVCQSYSCLSQEWASCLMSAVLYMFVFVALSECVVFCVPLPLQLSVLLLALGMEVQSRMIHSDSCSLPDRVQKSSELMLGRDYNLIPVYFPAGGSGGRTPDPALRSRHPPTPLLQWYGEYQQCNLMKFTIKKSNYIFEQQLISTHSLL